MAGFNETPFRVENEKRQSIYGVIHIPENPNGNLVMLFNIGLHYRVNHSRLFVRQARRLQDRGFIVARLDTSKVGYSHGEMPVGRAIDSYDSVQTGLFVDDARLAVRYLADRFKPKKIFFSGLCGGALTAIITASLEKEIAGVVFIAGPVTVTSAEAELSTMHPVSADIALRGYLRKLLSPRSWARFFSGKTTYSRIFRALKTKINESMRPDSGDLQVDDSIAAQSGQTKGERFNRVYYRSFDEMMKSGREILFVMPELDRATYDFRRMFEKTVLKKYENFKNQYEIARVEKADHTFSRPASSQQLFEIIEVWLIERI